jgi:hypothetical protein
MVVGYHEGDVEVHDATSLKRLRSLPSEDNRAHTAMSLVMGPGDRLLLVLLVGEYLLLPEMEDIPLPDPLLEVYDLDTGRVVSSRAVGLTSETMELVDHPVRALTLAGDKRIVPRTNSPPLMLTVHRDRAGWG